MKNSRAFPERCVSPTVDYSIVRVNIPVSRGRDNIVARSRDFHGNRRKETRIPFFLWRTLICARWFYYGLLLRL